MRWSAVAAAKRILNREQRAVVKDWGGKLPIALVYPNAYYVGMSSLALHTLYRHLNARPDVACERVFAGYRRPGDDLAPLSIETQRPLGDFAILATTLSFELDYLHLVTLLRKAGIRLLWSAREDQDPLLLAGGPAVSANPEPLSLICDAFFIGEVEETLPLLLDTLRDGISGKRPELWSALAQIPGVYVPALTPEAKSQTPVSPVTRQWVRQLDQFPTHSSVLTRATEFGDMYLIEIARGCGRACRFCLTGCLYRPRREYRAAILLELASAARPYRSKVGLVSAAVSDYSQIEELVWGLREMDMQVSVSSLRVDPLPETLLEALAAGGTRTLTIAPEAGSERLRSLIHKNVRDDDILRAAERAEHLGFAELKLYFMIGLPGEEDEDMAAIVQLVQASQRHFTGRILVSVAPFVPKAHTPFERVEMAPVPVIRDRLQWLQSALNAAGVRLASDSLAWASIQAVLARGDRQLGKVLTILPAPTLSGWNSAMQAFGLQAEQYTRGRLPDEVLPWSVVRVSSGLPTPHATQVGAQA